MMKRALIIICMLATWLQVNACTTFTFSNKAGQRVFGRNYDFPVGYGHIQLNYRGMYKTSFIQVPETPFSWESEYGSITFNQAGREFPYGGMNEAGLVVEQMWLQETMYPESDERFGLSMLQWIQYQLDCSASVQELIDSDSQLRISNTSVAPLHFLVSDASGDVATIEYLDGKMIIHRGQSLPYPVLANCTYAHSLEYRRSLEMKEDIAYNDWTLNSSGRFTNAANMIDAYCDEEDIVNYSFHILNKVAQGSGTQWSIVYDITNRCIHYKSTENSRIQIIDMKDLDFSCKNIQLYIDMKQDVSGEEGFQELNLEKNLTLIDKVFSELELVKNSIPEGANMAKAKYAQSILCLPFQSPADRYFNLVLPNNYTLIKEVKLTHCGFFKSSQKSEWMKIKGEQQFKTGIPEFQWIGQTNLFKATDRFVNDKGQLKVKLFGLIPIVNTKGCEVDQAELLRWLGESIWFPTNLLPSDRLHWSAVDTHTAKLTYSYNDMDIFYIVRFDEKGLITELETERYMSKGRMEKWVGQVSDYKKFDGMLIPTHIKALWRLEEGDFQYVDFYVNTIDYEY